ncbi:MAG TPA: C39 family peptidase [Stellaceae bacterium]|nr:C39 family peptidase [Stellaceae bacterium]
MRTRGVRSAAIALGLTALSLGGCGFPDVGTQPPAQYAALNPRERYASDYTPLRIPAEKPVPPVRSLLETRHHDVVIQKWDLSCGAAALATLLRYEFGDHVTERQIALGLMSRGVYVKNPQLVQIREGFSLFDLKRYLEAHGYKGLGFGNLDFNDLVERAPLMVPINALGYNHFVVFRGVMGNTVLLADPAWGNRTMTIVKFKNLWLDYGKPMGHVGFVVERADGGKPLNRLQPKPSDFVMLGTPPNRGPATEAGALPKLADAVQRLHRGPATATGGLRKLANLARQLLAPRGRERAHERFVVASRAE